MNRTAALFALLATLAGCTSTVTTAELFPETEPDAGAAIVPGPDAAPSSEPDAHPAAAVDTGIAVVVQAEAGADAQPAAHEVSPGVDAGSVVAMPEAGQPRVDAAPTGDARGEAAAPGDGGAVSFLCQLPDDVNVRRMIALVEATFPGPCSPDRAQRCGGVPDPAVGQVTMFPVECRCGRWTLAWVPVFGTQLASVMQEFECAPGSCAINNLCPR